VVSSNGMTSHHRVDSVKMFGEIRAVLADSKTKRSLQFRKNPTLYRLVDEYRFVQTNLDATTNGISYDFASIDSSIYVETILCELSGYRHYKELTECLSLFPEVDTENAEAFVEELIDSQVLISEIEPYVAGPYYLESVMSKLAERNLAPPERLTSLQSLCSTLNNTAHDNTILDQVDLSEDDTQQLLQADLSHSVIDGHVDESLVREIQDVIMFLTKTSFPYSNDRLREFKDSFELRYERKRVPLLQLFDPDSGLPSADLAPSSPLVESLRGLATKKNTPPLPKIIKERALKLEGTAANEIDVSDLDDQSGSLSDHRMPTTLSAMVELFSSDAPFKACLISASQSSAVNVLARFTGDCSSIKKLAAEICMFEQSFHGSSILADVSHIPISYRSGNVVHRDRIWPYEIALGVNSTYDEFFQIHLSEIEVSLAESGEICLWKKGGSQKILPRKSTVVAHDACTPLYKFLVDVECQGKFTSIGLFDIEGDVDYVPRIKYKSILLKPATWRIAHEEFDALENASNQQTFLSNVEIWRNKRRLPKVVLLMENDNEMPIHFDSKYCLDFLSKTLKKKKSIVLREFLFAEFGSCICDERGEQYTNQIIISYFKNGDKSILSRG
jgi:hypothetical protein